MKVYSLSKKVFFIIVCGQMFVVNTFTVDRNFLNASPNVLGSVLQELAKGRVQGEVAAEVLNFFSNVQSIGFDKAQLMPIFKGIDFDRVQSFLLHQTKILQDFPLLNNLQFKNQSLLLIPKEARFSFGVSKEWKVTQKLSHQDITMRDMYFLEISSQTLHSLIERVHPNLKGSVSSQNIEALNKMLAQLPTNNLASANEEVYKYRLEILKAFGTYAFNALSETVQDKRINSIINLLMTALGIVGDTVLHRYFSYLMMIPDRLFTMTASKQEQVGLQLYIDGLVMASLDSDLVKTRINELQIAIDSTKKASAGGYWRALNRYLPTSLQWGELGYESKVVDLMKRYLRENDLELALAKKLYWNKKNLFIH